MDKNVIFYSLFMLLGVFISSLSQVLLKKESQKHHDSVIAEYLNVRVIVAYGIFFSATLLSVLAYRVVPLSLGPILSATSYIYVTIFGVTIFHEKLNPKKIAALAMILAGIAVYALLG